MRKRMISALLVAAVLLSLLPGCASQSGSLTDRVGDLTYTGSMQLDYATEFSVDEYEGGYRLLKIADGSRFLTVPEGQSVPQNLPDDITPISLPLKNVYLAATASMCLFDALDGLDAIRLSGTQAEGWYIENARKAMENGKILFAGKYNEPDYERLLSEGCTLAVESTMIGHASEVKDKLEELGISVLVDHASLEEHPLGRTEWIKLYGVLLGKEDEAKRLFDEQVDYLQSVSNEGKTGKTVAFFYVSSSGRVVARKSGDYVSRMIELAGGEYVFQDLGDSKTNTSTVTIEMETFYATAKDADYIIYNSTIGGAIGSIDELLKKSSLFSEFKAVQTGNVWCTGQNMYQQTTQLGQMIQSFHQVFTGEADGLEQLPFLYRLH